MTLEEFANFYFANHLTGIKKNTQQCYYLPAARMFDRSVGVPIEQLSKEAANKFVDWLKSQPKAARTQHSRRRAFATLWNSAHESGMAPAPVQFRKVVVPKRSPIAWGFDTVQMIVDSVKHDKSHWTHGMEFGVYWASLFSAAWDSALRLGDLLSMECRSIMRDKRGAGLIRVIQSKTNREHCAQFQPSTMAIIDRSIRQSPNRKLLWPIKSTRRRFYEDFQGILSECDVKGTFRYFRRSAVTYAESQNPGSGQLMAGHQDARTTRESYLDPMLLPKPVVIVKSLS